MPYFKIHIIQIITSIFKEKLYQFEIFWWSAINEEATMTEIESYINKHINCRVETVA